MQAIGSWLLTTMRALITACLVVVLLPIHDGSAAAAEVTSAWARSWAYLPVVTGALASGHLTAAGAPSAGATVVLFGQPAGDASATPLSRTVTGSDGSWSIGVPANADLTGYADPLGGDVNLYVQTFDATGTATYFLSAESTSSAGAAVVAGNSRTLAVDPQRSRDIALDSATVRNRATTTADALPGKSGGPTTICGDKVLGTYHNIKTQVGYTADEAGGNSAVHFYFSHGASASLGVGVSASGGMGGFSASGTYSISSSLGADFPTTHNVAYKNYYAFVAYKRVQHTCVTGSVASSSYQFRPFQFDGGFTYSSAPRIGMSHCSLVRAGTIVHKTTTTAYEASAGVSAGNVININLSARSGYNTDVSINYDMGDHGHPWCGLSDYPGGNSRLQTIHSTVWDG